MFDKVLIFKKIVDGVPFSNNRTKEDPMLTEYDLGFKNKYISLTEIDDSACNYAYVINHDYNRCFMELPLYEYIEKFNVIPEIVTKLIKENRCILVLDAIYEGYSDENYFRRMYDVLDYFSIRPNQFLYVTAALGAPDINREFCTTHNIPEALRVFSVPLFKNIMKTGLIVGSIEKDRITKKFMCLNHILREHRVVFGTHLFFRKHLLKETFFSMPNVDQHSTRFEQVVRSMSHKICRTAPNFFPNSRNFGESVYDMLVSLPMVLDSGPVNTFDPTISPINGFYNHSLFNIVTETAFYESVTLNHPNLFLTEKMFKPMVYLQVPIVLGGPGLVAEMRKIGFDMFDDIVDHTYDTIYDHDVRMDTVLDQIEKINAKYTLDEVNKLSIKLQDRLKSNRSLLLS